MPELLADKSNVIPFVFHRADCGASLTDQALEAAGEATAADLPEIPCPWAGSIVGVSVAVEAARTAGTLTVEPTIDGSDSGIDVVIDDDPTQYNTAKYRRGQYPVTAGQRIGVDITTDSSWAAGTTPSILVIVFVHVEEL